MDGWMDGMDLRVGGGIEHLTVLITDIVADLMFVFISSLVVFCNA